MVSSSKPNTKKPCELYTCLRHPIKLCRWTGLFPVEVLDSSSLSDLRPNFKFIYMVYYAATVGAQTVTTAFSFFWFFLHSFDLLTLTKLVFYFTGLIETMLLLKLALQWSQFMKRANDIENSLAEIRKSNQNFWKYGFTTYTVLLLALAEHSLSIIYNLSIIMSCMEENYLTIKVIKEYLRYSVPFVFEIVSYSFWKGILLFIVNIQATFLWNITDVMTMCVSIYLTSYFQDLNNIIRNREKYKLMSWEKMREYYSNMVALVKEVDSKFCYILLLSFFSNLFFICVQFFNTLNYGIRTEKYCSNKNVNGSSLEIAHQVYYMFSFLFLIMRASTMSILAANVHKAAQEPMYVVSFVPTAEYTLEVERFNRQIRYTTTALSGVFFYVTRQALISVVGTILTYELVLLQFNQNDEESALQRNESASIIHG